MPAVMATRLSSPTPWTAPCGAPGTGDFVFDRPDDDQRLTIHGFNSSVGTVRNLGRNLRPLQVAIYSSTTDTASLTNTSFETQLVSSVSLASRWTPADNNTVYAQFNVAAPAGTRSLFFDFGAGNDTTGDTGFARVCEVQAFATPEPSTMVWRSAVCSACWPTRGGSDRRKNGSSVHQGPKADSFAPFVGEITGGRCTRRLHSSDCHRSCVAIGGRSRLVQRVLGRGAFTFEFAFIKEGRHSA